MSGGSLLDNGGENQGGNAISAPFIWIILPLISSIISYPFRNAGRWVNLFGMLIAGLLGILAFVLPIDTAIPIRFWSGLPAFVLKDSIQILGASLLIDNPTRPILAFLYFTTVIWFAGSLVISPSSLLVPTGLGIVGILSAAVAVRPSIFSPLLVGTAALFCIPLLSPTEDKFGVGTRRFLIYQIFGMLFIFLAYLFLPLSAVQTDAGIPQFIPTILFSIGYAFILPVIPFHSWLVMVLEETRPFPALFAFFSLNFVNVNLLVGSISRLSINNSFEPFLNNLQVIGIAVVVISGVWIMMEKHLGRALGFVFLQQIGSMLLIIRLTASPNGDLQDGQLFSAQFIPFILGMFLCALALEIIREKTGGQGFLNISGEMRGFPVVSTSLLLGIISLAGFPFLAGFLIQYKLLVNLVKQSLFGSILSLTGLLMLGGFGLRIFFQLNQVNQDESLSLKESPGQRVFLCIIMVLLVILGLFPGIYNQLPIISLTLPNQLAR